MLLFKTHIKEKNNLCFKDYTEEIRKFTNLRNKTGDADTCMSNTCMSEACISDTCMSNACMYG